MMMMALSSTTKIASSFSLLLFFGAADRSVMPVDYRFSGIAEELLCVFSSVSVCLCWAAFQGQWRSVSPLSSPLFAPSDDDDDDGSLVAAQPASKGNGNS